MHFTLLHRRIGAQTILNMILIAGLMSVFIACGGGDSGNEPTPPPSKPSSGGGEEGGGSGGGDTPTVPEVPIEFTVPEEAGTRAALPTYISSGFKTNSTIGVFAFYTGQTAWASASSTATPNFMYNQSVQRQLNGSWSYSPIKYWPNQQDDKLTFCAYFPHGGTGVTPSLNTATGLPVITFSVQEYSKDQVDLLMSEVVADEQHITSSTQTNVSYKVSLSFKHALSQIVVNVVDGDHADNPLPFTATIIGWYDSGDCQPSTSAAVNWSSRAIGGTVFSTEGSDTEGLTETNKNRQRIFLMIPGVLNGVGAPDGAVQMRFNYLLGGVPFVTDPVDLKATTGLTEWKPGKTYNYTYRVQHTGNDLSIAVNPWYQSGLVFDN